MSIDSRWERARKVPLKDYEGDCLYFYDGEHERYYMGADGILLDNDGKWPDGVYGTTKVPIELDPCDIADRLEDSDDAYEDYEMPHEGYQELKDFCRQWNEKYRDVSYWPDFEIGIVDGDAE